jgi:anti-sigma B factor antagonist
MDILEEKKGDSVVLGLQGRLDHTTIRTVEQKLLAVVAEGCRYLVVDLAGLDYISSAGLRVLLSTAKKLKASGGRIVLCAVKQYVKEILDVSGFSSIFPTYASRAEAVEAVQQKR